MSDFQLVPPFHEYETPESFVFRLAAYNCIDSASDLYRLVGTSYEETVDGSASASLRLAKMAGLKPDVYRRYAVRRTNSFAYVNGQKIRSDHLSRMKPRYCPVCVCADIEKGRGPVESRPYQRFWWWYTPMEHCADHGCAMSVSEVRVPGRSSADFAAFVRDNVARIRREAAAAKLAPLHAFERYVHRRLVGQEQRVELLDDVPLHVAVTFCDAVGRLSSVGHREAGGTVEDKNRGGYRRHGFDVVSRGKDHFLAYLHQRARDAANARGITKLNKYGAIHARLNENLDNPDWLPLIEMVRKDALATLPLAAGDEILGHVVEERRIHSLHSAHLDYGVHPKTLWKLLQAHDILVGDYGRDSAGTVIFEVATVKPLLERINGSVTKGAILETLDIPLKSLNAMRERGIIRAIKVDPVFGKAWPRYVKADLKRVVADIEAMPLIRKVDDGFRSLETVHFWGKVSVAAVIEKIRQGRVRAVRTAGLPTIPRVFVHHGDTIAATQLMEHGGISVSQAAKMLHTHVPSINRLLALGYLKGEERLHHVTRRVWTYLEKADIEAFDAKYVSLYEVSKEEGAKIDLLMGALDAAGMEPLFVPGEKEARFYDRAAISEFLMSGDFSFLGKRARKRAERRGQYV